MPIGVKPPKDFRGPKMRKQMRTPRTELRKLQRECKHQWEEQTGSEPVIDAKSGMLRLEDVCIHCGLARR